MDVYSDWVDACDAVAKDTANQYDGPVGSQVTSNKPEISAAAEDGEAYDDDEY